MSGTHIVVLTTMLLLVGGIAVILVMLLVMLFECRDRNDQNERRHEPEPLPPRDGEWVTETPAQRGELLLLRLLTSAQQYEYSNYGTITVPISTPGSQYPFAQIGKRMRGVRWLPDHTRSRLYDQCVYLVPECPQTGVALAKQDDLVAKLLWLRTDPVSLAKVSGLTLCPRPFPEWFRASIAPQ